MKKKNNELLYLEGLLQTKQAMMNEGQEKIKKVEENKRNY